MNNIDSLFFDWKAFRQNNKSGALTSEHALPSFLLFSIFYFFYEAIWLPKMRLINF